MAEVNMSYNCHHKKLMGIFGKVNGKMVRLDTNKFTDLNFSFIELDESRRRKMSEIERLKGKILILIEIVEDNLIYWMDSEQSDRGADAIQRIKDLCKEVL